MVIFPGIFPFTPLLSVLSRQMIFLAKITNTREILRKRGRYYVQNKYNICQVNNSGKKVAVGFSGKNKKITVPMILEHFENSCHGSIDICYSSVKDVADVLKWRNEKKNGMDTD